MINDLIFIYFYNVLFSRYVHTPTEILINLCVDTVQEGLRGKYLRLQPTRLELCRYSSGVTKGSCRKPPLAKPIRNEPDLPLTIGVDVSRPPIQSLSEPTAA